jgi:hypothetical protein
MFEDQLTSIGGPHDLYPPLTDAILMRKVENSILRAISFYAAIRETKMEAVWLRMYHHLQALANQLATSEVPHTEHEFHRELMGNPPDIQPKYEMQTVRNLISATSIFLEMWNELHRFVTTVDEANARNVLLYQGLRNYFFILGGCNKPGIGVPTILAWMYHDTIIPKGSNGELI